jgi:glutamate formiminotransferase / 5-formyltetrahydrofolate cyclo-ligase
VVPWVDLDQPATATAASVDARDRFARWAAAELGLPCFLYGPDSPLGPGPGGRSLPDLRRRAWHDLAPDVGPDRPHPTAGAAAVGARGVLVAYNLWLETDDPGEARRVATAVRRPGLRTLGLSVGSRTQVSCNLTDPARLGPARAHDLVATYARIHHSELVGLLPRAVLMAVPPARWAELDLSPDRTIEARLAPAQP